MGEWEDLGQRIIDLANKLVREPSVVDSAGEAAVADLLARYLEDQLARESHVTIKTVTVPKPTDCRAVIAFVKTQTDTRKTLLLMGHIDTVGLEPYGPLGAQAFDSDALKAAFADHRDPLVAAQAADPEWLFGRGWHDMKGGVAAITEIFIREAKLRQLPANLVLLLTPDEESASRGLRALIPELIRLKSEQDLVLTQVINADYTTPLFDGDDNRYLYSGVVGKLLLGLSVFGKTTHVGETFDGVNASALGGYLAHALEHNRKLVVGRGGEWLPPPTILKASDQRQQYDVMTQDYAELYANLFHLGDDPGKLWRKIIQEIRRIVRRYDSEMRRRYNRFSARADLNLPRAATRLKVISYSQLLDMAGQHCSDLELRLSKFAEDAQADFADDRDRALAIVRQVHALMPPQEPLIVASLLPPFYPARIAVKGESSTVTIKEFCQEHGIKHRWIYPYISDMSYFAFVGQRSLKGWQDESPIWFAEGEVDEYAQVATSVCNLGPWGIGAHKAEERVYLPYLRDELPRQITDLLYRFATPEPA